ncbi:sensor histidine kinase NtrY-like [Sphingomonas sp.]|uniref:sensor histidine kinase NtrY-like n=1 Tax=Sphingomonas sp. TaxID=28214 RepID=UPI002EDB836C
MTDSDDAAARGWFAVNAAVELAVLAIAILVAVGSYMAVSGVDGRSPLLAPSFVAVLLVANLVPGIMLIMLAGRRIAMRRAARSPVGGRGRLHVRLVVLFSVMAAVPITLVAIVASLLMQYGVEFGSSQRARAILDSATGLVRASVQREIDRTASQTTAMAADVGGYLRAMPIESKRFSELLLLQTYNRELSDAMILRRDERDPLVVLNPYGRPMENIVTPAMMAQLDAGAKVLTLRSRDRAAALVPLAYGSNAYLYTSRVFDEQVADQLQRGAAVSSDYRALQSRSRSLQLRFNVALLALSLLIVGVAVWIALAVADRLVRPVGELVEAARRVAAGDLTARVPDPRARDEVGTLARAFNQMTGRLQQQNSALVTANDQLDARRALIEAVMAGVSAGVIATGPDRTIRIANTSATTLLGTGSEGLAGRRLAEVAPQLDALLDTAGREAIAEIAGLGGETRTLAVRIVRTDAGPILTFDDITQQLLDQRRAAWSDVARRIAHEIKNPLTPIQLAAERLQRRYGGKIAADDGTFARLTETIVRQVGDLRRMVDEFSSFARMPKPVFRSDSLIDVARQALFLHEVAHPNVTFTLVADEAPAALVMDRRQLGQALTNIVKNAVEAIEAKGDAGGSVTMILAGQHARFATISVEDTGVGLPAERDRIIEPYMTTRARGTGLGLAIVKKIAEEHFGTITFTDRPGGGTIVTMTLDTGLLAACDEGDDTSEPAGGGQLTALTRNRN